jgi:nitroreductase
VQDALAAAAWGQTFIAQARVVIAVCADPGQSAARYHERGEQLYCLQDTAAATEHILLAAVAEGLGTCWIGAFEEELAAEALDLDPKLRPVALVPVGYPAREGRRRTSRRTVSEVVSYI